MRQPMLIQTHFGLLEFIPKPNLSYDSEDGDKQPILIVRPLEDQECFEGDSVSFICEVKGHPKPQVSLFYKNF
jgi:hypothetical protein